MVVPPGSTPKLVQLTTDPRIFDRITITAGRRPAPVTGDGTVVEVVLTAGNAERMRWKVGQVRSFTLQSGSEFEVRLSGTFRVDDPSNPYWRQTYNVNALTIPVASAGKVLATGFVDPRSLSQLTSFGFDLQTRIWYPTRLDALSLATAGGVAEQSRRFTSLGHTIDGAGTGQVAFSTQLASLLDAAATRTTTTLSVVAAIFAGPLGAALALVVLVTRLALLQARSALILLAGRGASRSRLRATVALVTALASIPSAAVGLLVGSLLTGVLPHGQGLLAAAITAAVPIVVAAVLLPRPRRGARFGLCDRSSRRSSSWRHSWPQASPSGRSSWPTRPRRGSTRQRSPFRCSSPSRAAS
ncbi:hypothetical protein GCM10025867_35210 [Frondihabitans sucicola]|uniref:FtsX-like permease family protein n=2 Tax=Frondihabitans sucicola TaxID=1268041 RepID=A0ABN6Y1U0_9MICO|nr:hypothetical protein GCM10025867_35210 [Frondihabitans sucicola]